MDRDEAIRTLEGGRDALAGLFGRLSGGEMTRPATIGGGDWSAKDLLAHISAWERNALVALADWRRGERPWIEDVIGTDEGVDRANAGAAARDAAFPVDEIRGEADASHRALVTAIAGMSDDDWNEQARYARSRPVQLGELLGIITGAPGRPFGHAFAHSADLEAYVASLSG